MKGQTDPKMSDRRLSDPERLTGAPSYPWWLYLVVFSGSFLMIAGALIALIDPMLLVGPGRQLTEGVKIYAGYLVSRNLTIGLLLLLAQRMNARASLCTLMLATALIQFVDGAIDLIEQRWTIIPMALVIGIAFLIGARRVAGSSLWRPSSWN
jgi:hypothetical protein